MNPLARLRIKAQMARNSAIEAEMRQRAAVDASLAQRKAEREKHIAVMQAVSDVAEAFGAPAAAIVEPVE